MTTLRVFLADDHEVVREGLKTLINAQRGMGVIGEAGDGPTALQRAKDLKPDIAVLDVSMPELNGAQVTERLKEAVPDVKVLALTVHEDKSYLRQLLRAGASGYVLKRSAADELIHAIRTLAAGRTYIDPSLADTVVASFVRNPTAPGMVQPDRLSDRETEVVRLIAQGYSNKEVAGRLNLSVRTVETYKGRFMEKLGFKNRTELVRYAMQQGWLQDL
ncbi:MAG TPA: response regulator transcription factor [Nitrospiraceae bacterium]|nr:response regulator transcription factor [Nitrospiraceae bacterium]